jgi:hypothetical protein
MFQPIDIVRKRDSGRRIIASASANPKRAAGELGYVSICELATPFSAPLEVGIQNTCNLSERRLRAALTARPIDSYGTGKQTKKSSYISVD